MKQRPIWLAMVFLVAALCNSLLAQDVNLSVTATRDQIYLGESVNLTVKISGAGSSAEPDLSSLNNCSIRRLGNHSFSSFSMINGSVTRESANIFDYEITPTIAGKFVAGPVRVKTDGGTISRDGPVIEVVPMQAQKDVLIRITSSRESVLVDEPFEVVLAIAIRQLKGQYADAHPLDQNEPPSLNVPFLDPQPIAGLEGPDMKSTLEKYLSPQNSGPGFALNNYTVRNQDFPFGMGFPIGIGPQQQPAKFLFEKSVIQTNGESYLNYAITLKYTARQEGAYTFGPATFKGKIAVDVDAQGRGLMKPIFAVGPAYTVRVVPPPEQGRPPSYVGAIGSNAVVDAMLDTQTCNVGDPLKLTLSISGNLSLDNICPPVLSDQPDMVRSFKVYDDTVQAAKKDGVREYTYTVRPIRDGTIELPAILVSYFDSSERIYRTLKTKPIPVRVNKAATVGSEIIIATATNRAAEERTRVSDMFIPAPLNVDPSGAGSENITGGAWNIAPLVAGPVLYLLTISVVHGRRRFARNAGARRRRRALKHALSVLHGTGNAGIGDSGASMGICNAIRTYLADRFDLPEAGMTPADARRILGDAKLDGESFDALCLILERNFNAGYDSASADFNVKQDREEAGRLLRQIDDKC
jgi:hypothetical protein